MNIIQGLAALIAVGSVLFMLCAPRRFRTRVWALGAAYMSAKASALVVLEDISKANYAKVASRQDFN